MAKLTLTDITTLDNPSAVAAINANSAAIEAALENTLSRDGTAPNEMGADLDMDSYDLLNVGNVEAERLFLGGVEVLPSEAILASDSAAISFLQAGTGATLRTVQDKLRDIVSVKDFGAVGDGVTDDTAAIQLALDAAQGSGAKLFIPAGTYRTTAPLVVSQRISMYGEGADPESLIGSWFYFDHAGVGFNLSLTGETLGNFMGGFGTRRNQPAPGPGWVDLNHDFDIDAVQTTGGDIMFADIMLLNASNGIRATGRATFDRVRGQVFRNFISAPFNADKTRFNDCHAWPFWSTDSNVRDYMLANSVCFRLARVDNPIMSGCFSIWQFSAVEIVDDGVGTVSKLHMTNCDFDLGTNGIRVLGSANNATMSISNFQCQSFAPLTTGGIGLHVLASNCFIQIDQATFSFHRQNGIRVEGSGNTLSIGSLRIEDYDSSLAGFAAIDAAAGNTVAISSRPNITRALGFSSPKFSGAGAISAPLNYGLATGTTNAGGDVTVTHSANAIPNCILITNRAPDSARTFRVDSVTPTQMTIRCYEPGGGVVVSEAIEFYWRVDY